MVDNCISLYEKRIILGIPASSAKRKRTFSISGV
jgi:hypothetical protein